MKAFLVNLQGNIETNTQLGLRNHKLDVQLNLGLPLFHRNL